MMTVSMTARLILAADGPHGVLAYPVRVRFRYDPADPYAIVLEFEVAGGLVRWMFARDLLTEGLTADAGVGDVRFFPHEDTIDLVIESPDGRAQLVFSRADLERALDQAEALVPSGGERFDFDREIAHLGRAA